MAGLKDGKVSTNPLPVKGINFRDSLPNMDPQYSPWLLNVLPENGMIRVKTGERYWCNLSANQNLYDVGVVPQGSTDKIYGIVSSDNINFQIYDLTVLNTPTFVANSNFFTGSPTTTNFFNKNLFFFDTNGPGTPGVTQGVRIDTTGAINAINYTYSAAAGAPIMAVNYKSRQYIVSYSNLNFEYTDIGAISGATHGVDLANIFSGGLGMAWVAVFSTQDGVANSQYIAFGNDAGEVLIYGGDYAGSSTWGIVARFKIGIVINTGNNTTLSSVLNYQSDSLILTKSGVVSLRSLFLNGQGTLNNGVFTQGQNALNRTVSDLVDPYLQYIQAQQIANSVIQTWSMIFYPEQNKILILAKGYFPFVQNAKSGNFSLSNDLDGQTFIVLNTLTGAWSILYNVHTATNTFLGNRMIYANGMVFYFMKTDGGTHGWLAQYEGKAALTDRSGNGYEYVIQHAWTTLGSANSSRVQAVIPFLQSDKLTWKVGLGADFGIDQSNTVSPTSQPVGYQNPYVAVGISGTYIQIQLWGTTISAQTQFNYFGASTVWIDGGIR